MAPGKVDQLQLLQQNLQNVLLQKQQLQAQLGEISSALEGLESTAQAYKIVGALMLAAPQEELKKELQEKKEITEIRLKNLAGQEERLKESVEKAQPEALEELKKSRK